MQNLLIHSVHILDPSDNTDTFGDILVRNGKIVQRGGNITCCGAREIGGCGLTASPGLVDIHVHLRDPGQTQKEDVFSGCRAAAAGGVTSLMCMPNTIPPIDTPETVKYVLDKAKKADARVYVCGAVSKGLCGQEAACWRSLKEAGAVALSDDGRPVASSALMARAMRDAQRLGLAVCAHCEDASLSTGGKMNEGKVSAELGVNGIPAAAENCGTAREISLAASYGVPVHICHVSTAVSTQMVRCAKQHGIPVTAETAPHYFSLTENELLSRDADFRMNPPLRTEKDRLAVIEGLRDGTIDAIATDHAPHTPHEKADFLSAPSGAIGMETSLAAGITYLVKPGYITLMQLLRLMTCSPADIIHIGTGTLQPGADADIVLFAPDEEWTVAPDKLHSKSRNAVFKGRRLTGKVKLTVCRGKIVYSSTGL